MSNFRNKMERYAVRNLSLVLVIGYAIGYAIEMLPAGSTLMSYLTLNPNAVIHGQIWRLVTWVLIPPSGSLLSTIITLFFYYSIGTSLERTWGDYLYNIYIFSGMLFTIIGSFLLMLYFYLKTGDAATVALLCEASSAIFSTYYINMSIFLAFAATFPEAQVLLMFIIPIKVKWLGIVDAVYLVYLFITSGLVGKIVIFVSLLNFVIFFVVQRYTRFGSPVMRAKQAVRRQQYRRTVANSMAPKGMSKHKCAICGRTEQEYPDLEFRFCTKCNGNYEYCSDHLFTHKHVE